MKSRSFFRLFKRTRWTTLGIFVVLSVVGIMAVRAMPLTWTSSARIVIERPDGTLGQSRPKSQELLYQRVDFLRSSILSLENIDAIARTQGYITDELPEYQVADVRKDIVTRLSIEVQNISVVNQYTGKLGLLPIALIVGFEGRSPNEALRMAKVFTDQVLSFNSSRESTSSQYKNSFLETEVDESSTRLETIEQRIATFKTANALLLPALHELYIKRMEEIYTGLSRSSESLANLEQDAAQTDAEIATVNPEALLFAPDGTRLESSVERLERARLALSEALVRYSDEHPEVIRLKNEVLALRGVTGGADTAFLEIELDTTRRDLAAAQERYLGSHPDVRRLIRKVDSLDRALQTAVANDKPELISTSVPSSPAYNRLVARRQSVASGIISEQGRAKELSGELEMLQDRLQLMPEIEGDMLALERQLSSEAVAYAELQTAQASEKLDAGLRSADLLETLSLIDEPSLPLSATFPDRQLLTSLVVFLALLCSLSSIFLRGMLSDTIWDLDDEDVELGVKINPIPVFR